MVDGDVVRVGNVEQFVGLEARNPRCIEDALVLGRAQRHELLNCYLKEVDDDVSLVGGRRLPLLFSTFSS